MPQKKLLPAAQGFDDSVVHAIEIINFSKIPTNNHQHKNDAAEREFDAYLREIDDYLPNHLGDAPGLSISPDFVPRVVERARAEMRPAVKAAKQGWSIRHWFFDFNLAARVAMASAVLLTTFGGFRAGRVMTEVIARQTKSQPVEMADPLGLAAPEQSIVRLMRTDEVTSHNQSNKPTGEER